MKYLKYFVLVLTLFIGLKSVLAEENTENCGIFGTSVYVGETTYAGDLDDCDENGTCCNGVTSYTSSDTQVATVDPFSGLITGIKEGAATITARRCGRCMITSLQVSLKPAERKLTPAQKTIKVGETVQLSFSLKNEETGVVLYPKCMVSGDRFVSSNISVASVSNITGDNNSNGMYTATVTGVNPGVATITFDPCGNDYHASNAIIAKSTITVVENIVNPQTGSFLAQLAVILGFVSIGLVIAFIERVMK